MMNTGYVDDRHPDIIIPIISLREFEKGAGNASCVERNFIHITIVVVIIVATPVLERLSGVYEV